jgi:protein TonB
MQALMLAAIVTMALVSSVCEAGETARPAPSSEWLRQPTAEEAGDYPNRAQRMEVSGSATIDCRVTSAQILEDCRAVAETPLEYGFAEHALKLAPFIRMPAPTPEETERGMVRRTYTIVFQVPQR